MVDDIVAPYEQLIRQLTVDRVQLLQKIRDLEAQLAPGKPSPSQAPQDGQPDA